MVVVMPPKLKFSDNEKVLCFHGPLLYEAKCLKAQMKDRVPKFFIHYNGWNKNWDEWVPESRVLKFNEANLQKQKDLQQQHQKHGRGRKKPTERGPIERPERLKRGSDVSIASEPPRKRRRLETSQVDQEEAFSSRVEIKVRLPDELKHSLVDDWDLITRQKQLVQLPHTNTVEAILDEYLKNKGRSSSEKDAGSEICQGLREYFNVLLGTQLLYKFERPQYAELVQEHPGKAMSELYGPEHLLRLFVKLGAVLAYTPLDSDSMSLLLSHVNNFLKYLVRRAPSLFSPDNYHPAPPEYYRKMA